MPPTLQPKAGNWQQPEAALQPPNIGGVKSHAKIATLQSFGTRLSAVLDAKKWPPKKRSKQLSDLLKKSGITVTPETCRSWLAGEKAPGGANGQALSKALRANHAYLFHGDGEMFAADPLDDDLAEIQRTWMTLGARGRRYLMSSLAMAKDAQRSEDLEVAQPDAKLATPEPEQKTERRRTRESAR